MKNLKKTLSVIAILALTMAMILTGCGGGDSGDSGDQELALPRDQVQARLTTRSGDARILQGGQAMSGSSLSWGAGTIPCGMTSVSGDLTLRLV